MGQVKLKNDVIIGDDNWLFLYQGRHRQFSYLLQEEEIDPQNVAIFDRNISDRQSFCNVRGIKYKHIVFPSKPLLKSHFLPEKISQVKSLYNRYFSEHESVYYPLNDLRDRVEPRESTFRKFDTHMTDTAYWFIADRLLAQVMPEISTQIEFLKTDSCAIGDLTKMLNREETLEESFFKVPLEYTFYKVNNFDALKGNSGRIEIVNCLNSKSVSRLLIFGDSFFRGPIKLLIPFFKTIMFVRTPVFHGEIVEMYSPDVIFTGNAECYLQSVNSDAKAQPFLLSPVFLNNYHPQKEFLSAFSAQLSHRHYHKHYERWQLLQTQ